MRTIHSKVRIKLLLVFLISGSVIGAWYLGVRERVWFFIVEQSACCFETPVITRKYAEKLRVSPRGVRIALEDFCIYGGSAKGWSNWILENSPLDGLVEEGLRHKAHNASLPLSVRIEALLILWDRTFDPAYLRQCFALLKEPGPAVLGRGRRALMRKVQYSRSLSDNLMYTADEEALPITPEMLDRELPKCVEGARAERERLAAGDRDN